MDLESILEYRTWIASNSSDRLYFCAQIIRQYYEDGLEAVRGVLGEKTAIYIGDVFEADKFNDGFWQDSRKYENTLIDSHYYHGALR